MSGGLLLSSGKRTCQVLEAAFFLSAFGASAQVTFNRDLAPILFEHCAPCHRPGEAGPFSLLSYSDAKRHARQIVQVTGSRFMPPWLPEPGQPLFQGEHRLTAAQIRLFARWAEQGEEQGKPADLPPAPHFVEGWQLGEPDLVLKLPAPYILRSGGPDVYRNFVFPFSLDGLHYVRALEVRPGNRRVVHHANVLIDRNRSVRWRDGGDGQPGFSGMDLSIATDPQDPDSHFLFWKPGSAPDQSPPGMSWSIEKGADLILNMHLQPTGKPEPVQPVLGLYFTDEAPRLKPILVQLENDRALDIPAGTSDFTVTDEFTLPTGADLLAIYPHSHYLGKEVEGLAALPDGSRKRLIWIRHWDLNWQAVYRYQEPVFLPKGTKVSMRWVFDNSSANPRNPSHPPKRVRSGDQATDEMSHLWLQLLPRGGAEARLSIEEALARKRIARDPADFTAEFNLGGVLKAEGDSAGSIRAYEQAVRIRPRDEVALNTLGAVLQLSGRKEEAEARYREALAVRPGYADAHYNLAGLLAMKGAEDEAIQHLREVVKLAPDDARSRVKLAELLEDGAQARAGRGDLAGATEWYRDLVNLTPEDAGAHINLGVSLARQGRFEEARALFEQALRIDPQSEPARKYLERAKAALERPH